MPADRERTDAILIDAAGRVVEKTVTIAQEEFELARLEIVEKVPALGRNLLRLVVAGLLAVVSLVLLVLALAWLLADYVFGTEHVWAGFAVLALVVLVPAVIIGLGALNSARKTGPPVPTKALAQASKLRRVTKP